MLTEAESRVEFLTPLPKNVHAVESRGRRYFYFQVNRGSESEGPRIRLSNPRSKTELAEARRRSLAAGAVWRTPIIQCFTAAKARAGANNLRFSIDAAFLFELLDKQEHRCAVSGIEFSNTGYEDCRIGPFGVSVDRIDAKRGYTKDNVRLVCCIANFAMGQWGLGALERLSVAIVQRTNRDQHCKTSSAL